MFRRIVIAIAAAATLATAAAPAAQAAPDALARPDVATARSRRSRTVGTFRSSWS